MAPQRHPRFSEEELRVMVEEIIWVEPQLFRSQVQHTSIAKKMDLWRRIVDRVKAVGQRPRTQDDIRKRWNDLRGKLRSVVSRHQIAVQRTGDGPPTPPPQLTTWEEQVLAKLHPEGLAGVAGGLDSGVLADLVNTMRDTVAHKRAPDTSLDDDQPSTSTGASGQEAPPQNQQVTSTPPPAEGEPPRKRSLRSRNKTENIAKTPVRFMLCPTTVSAHQKKGIWRAIAKKVRTLGVYHRRSTHCRKRWEDLRRWTKKTVEAQLGMASQRGRGARRTMTPLMYRILAVAYSELDGRLRASQQPQGGEYNLIQLTLHA
ncbi:hypothetical protein NDU88_004834 [Pleurodeles waltl]|uniref:Nuclear apoptosis-inducing factor 1 n=1 Tax=Pleurodeles waltl TaxID=8319 RepID=A0AAV7SK25_PLEWA|nr:hypothetical protein NDU88_004834 [Pleurodeles waltl]